MNEIKVSIFASAVRPQFFKAFLESLRSTSETYEVVFAGDLGPGAIVHELPEYRLTTSINEGSPDAIESQIPDLNFRYIHTKKIKPAQCYEIARRACHGETIAWTADDCEHTPDVYGKAYRFWKDLNDDRVALSIQTLENGQFCNMRVHSFFGCQFHTPLMAPLGLMSRKVMEDLGGFDRRYICGQYENDAIMRLIQAGGRVEIFGDRQNLIQIDHYRKHGLVRPFAAGYNHDREILEGSWTDGAGRVILTRKDALEPYQSEGLLERSQSFNLSERWD